MKKRILGLTVAALFCLGQAAFAQEVVVEGNIVKFKNVAEIESTTENVLPTINVFAKTETRVGYDAASVDPKDYESLKKADWYALVKNEKDLQDMGPDTNYMLAKNMKFLNLMPAMKNTWNAISGRLKTQPNTSPCSTDSE